MFSLKLVNNYLEIKIESKLPTPAFKDYNNFMKSLQGAYYVDDQYKWVIPKQHVDAFAEKYEDQTAWHTTIEQIKGIEEIILPDFPLLTDFTDFKLEPFDFQKQGISFLAHVGSGVIGDDMGLGKVKFH